MENTLIVDFDPFSKESRVRMVNNDLCSYVTVSSNVDELAEALVELAYTKNIFNILSHAPEVINHGIRKKVQNIEHTKYSENKIKIKDF